MTLDQLRAAGVDAEQLSNDPGLMVTLPGVISLSSWPKSRPEDARDRFTARTLSGGFGKSGARQAAPRRHSIPASFSASRFLPSMSEPRSITIRCACGEPAPCRDSVR